MKNTVYYLPLMLLLLAGQCQSPSKVTDKMDQENHKYTNALIHETSPYLLQHAHNPVDWHPWGEEAFELAAKEDKLVLVSIGYSACHWCHVMEHESFEDTLVAQFMNEHFVNIKVDREERPDVDQVYMNAVQLMTGSGGWPLNTFVLPDGRPFYGGTYFPKERWLKLLHSLVEMKENEPQKIEEYATSLTNGVKQSEMVVKVEEETPFEFSKIKNLVDDWSKYWDPKEGGPNRAPKFPMPSNYEFLLKYGELANDFSSADFALFTLDKMAQGGIYDQVGGGFSRYSTDKMWKVPHFEKMLYDNGQLVSLYSMAYAKTKDPEYQRVIEQTLAFIKREMTNDEGSFYSALDADSDGEEGKFYVWTKEELQAILGNDYDFVEKYYNVNSLGKWENDTYILLRREKDAVFANKNNLTLEQLHAKVDAINNKLLTARNKRIHPGLDDKVLTSWNALMIKGYVDAYKVLDKREYLDAAIKASEFIWKIQRHDGALNRTYKNGRSSINGYLEDYSFTIEAYIALYEATFDQKWLDRAKELMDYVIVHFYDEKSGMFWYTSDLDPPLIARKMEVSDNVIPSSNSSIAKGLFLLGTLYYNTDYIAKSDQMMKNVLPALTQASYNTNWLQYMLMRTKPFYEIAITGKEYQSILKEFNHEFLPNTCYMGANKKSDLPLLEGKFMDKTMIFVCKEGTCLLPVATFEEARKQIKYD